MFEVSPLHAYSADVARVCGRERIGEHDAAWLLAAQILWRMASSKDVPAETWADSPIVADDELGVDDSSRHGMDAARRIARLAVARDFEVMLADVRALADSMEEANALALARRVLSDARQIATGASPLARGLTMAQEARVARKLGEFDVAADLYTAVGRLGARTREPELVARAELGHGILARIKGNYPKARTHFRRTLRVAGRTGTQELLTMGQQGLMVTAFASGDVNAALVHGWAALQHAQGDMTRESEQLINLARVCLDTGEHGAALAALLRASKRATSHRVKLPALAWAALAAARLGDRDTLSWCTGAVEHAISNAGLPFERAQVYEGLAEAWITIGGMKHGQRYLKKGLELARAYGFHELVFEFETLEQRLAAARSEAPALKPRAKEVVRAIEALPEEEASLYAISHSG